MWIDLVESVKIEFPLNVFIIADIYVLQTFDNNSICTKWKDLVESGKNGFPLNVFIINIQM